MNLLTRFAHVPKHVVLTLIRVYQVVLSPDHGAVKAFFPFGACRFSPSCSEYMKQRIEEGGLIRGIPRGVWQLLRCHPFSK